MLLLVPLNPLQPMMVLLQCLIAIAAMDLGLPFDSISDGHQSPQPGSIASDDRAFSAAATYAAREEGGMRDRRACTGRRKGEGEHGMGKGAMKGCEEMKGGRPEGMNKLKEQRKG